MIHCGACHRENDPWRRHCGRCGSQLPGGCVTCNFVNRPEERFCGGCGKSQRFVPAVVSGKTIPIDIGDLVVDAK